LYGSISSSSSSSSSDISTLMIIQLLQRLSCSFRALSSPSPRELQRSQATAIPSYSDVSEQRIH
jgi:hypothetical protein